MQLVLTWMDDVPTLYLFYIYLKCLKLQSVGPRVEKKIVMLSDDSICWLPQAGPFVWLNKSMATGNFSQQMYWHCQLYYRSKTEDQLITWYRWLLKEYAIIASLIWITWTTGVGSKVTTTLEVIIELNFVRSIPLPYA